QQQHTEPAGPGSAPPEGPPAHLHNGAALASPAPTGQNGVPAPNGTAFTSNGAVSELPATAPAVSGAGQWDGGPSGTSPVIQELEDAEPGSPTSGDELRGSEPSAAAGGNTPRNDGGDLPNGEATNEDAAAEQSSASESAGSAVESAPTPRSSPEVRPSPRRRRPTPAGRQR
ncbi:MAG: hypothetical protein QOC83_1536, partial [Pseudonocardiales bacterium]|nr:hypothetical protein [Pseudonocardiales bacterium]